MKKQFFFVMTMMTMLTSCYDENLNDLDKKYLYKSLNQTPPPIDPPNTTKTDHNHSTKYENNSERYKYKYTDYGYEELKNKKFLTKREAYILKLKELARISPELKQIVEELEIHKFDEYED